MQILGVRNISDPNNGRLLTPVGDIPFVREDDDYTIIEDAPRRNLNPAIEGNTENIGYGTSISITISRTNSTNSYGEPTMDASFSIGIS